MANKITKRDIINSMLQAEAIQSNQMWVDYLAHELELMDKKNAKKGESKTAEANLAIFNIVLEALTEKGDMTCTELIKTVPALAEYSTQKITSACASHVGIEIFKKVVKGKTYLSTTAETEVEGE